jgi:Mg2+/Co2+ transporter CorB
MTEGALTISLVILVLMLMAAAFFSGAETGLTGVNRAYIRSLQRQDNRRAGFVEKLRSQMDKVIGALMLGNNVINMAATALATTLTISVFGADAVPITTAILAMVVIVFGEVLPKTYAIRHPDRVALAVAPTITLFMRVFNPVIISVQWVVDLLLRWSPAPSRGESSASDQLRGAIDLHHEEGEIIKEDKDMLGGLLGLDDRTVYDVMIHRMQMFSIDIKLPVAEIIAAVVACPHSRIPLWQGEPENVIGVLHARDVLKALAKAGNQPEKITLAPAIRKPWFIPDSTTLKDQLMAFRARRSHFALVVDEYGSLEGMVTLEDILEEIVGTIDDEHDRLTSGIIPQLDGTVLVDGDVPIRDLNRAFDWSLPEEDAATIAGLLMHEAREIPNVGASYVFFDTSFEVLEKRKHQITRLRLERLSKETSV